MSPQWIDDGWIGTGCVRRQKPNAICSYAPLPIDRRIKRKREKCLGLQLRPTISPSEFLIYRFASDLADMWNMVPTTIDRPRTVVQSIGYQLWPLIRDRWRLGGTPIDFKKKKSFDRRLVIVDIIQLSDITLVVAFIYLPPPPHPPPPHGFIHE